MTPRQQLTAVCRVIAGIMLAGSVWAAPLPPLPGGLKFTSQTAPLMMSATPNTDFGNLVLIDWTTPTNPVVAGYYVFKSAGTNFGTAQRLTFTTNLSYLHTVNRGSTNYFWVTATNAGAESLPTPSFRYVAPVLPPRQALYAASWNYTTDGFYGLTNRAQWIESLVLTNWTTLLVFIGRGHGTNVSVTNSTRGFFRVIAY